jgi:hypothetical protein
MTPSHARKTEPIRVVIQRELASYSKQMNTKIKVANIGIGHTKKPGVAAGATYMRDDLCEVQNLFDSIKLIP